VRQEALDEITRAVKVLEIEVAAGARADDEHGLAGVVLHDVLHQTPRIQQRAAIDARRADGLRHRHRAVGGRIDHALAFDAMRDQRERRRMREARQRFGVELTREDAAGKIAGAGARGFLIEHRHDLFRPVRKRRDHGGGGEDDVEHYHHLARHAHAVQLLLFGEDVDLVL
jgi:hypothetical protein